MKTKIESLINTVDADIRNGDTENALRGLLNLIVFITEGGYEK